MNKKFLPPVIYDAKGNLDKRWNITYSIFNVDTERFDRFQHWISSSKFASRNLREKEARRLKKQIHSELKSGEHFRFQEVQYMSIQPVLVMGNLWLKQYRNEASTIKTYRAAFGHLKTYLTRKRLGNILPSDFTSKLARGFFDFLMSNDISNKTINHYVSTLNRFFAFLKAEDVIRLNAFRNIKRLKVGEVPVRRYTKEQTVHIMNFLKENDVELYCYCMIVYYAFMRLTEVRMLQVKHFDLELREINVSSEIVKTDKYKNPRISDPLLPVIEYLDLLGDPERFVFSKDGLSPYQERFLTKKFTKYFSPGWTIYRFKHTGMQDHREAGVPLQDIQSQGGITEAVMRKHYLEVEKRKVSDAILSLAPVIGGAKIDVWQLALDQLKSLSVEDQLIVKEKMGW